MRHAVIVIGALLTAYLVAAYLIAPFIWKEYATDHPSFDDNPHITQTADGHPGDPLNVALIGAEDTVRKAMITIEWYSADALGVRDDLRIAVDSVFARPYDDAPVSNLYLFERKQDLPSSSRKEMILASAITSASGTQGKWTPKVGQSGSERRPMMSALALVIPPVRSHTT